MASLGPTGFSLPPASWTQIRELLDLGPRNAYFEAASWALDTLQARLGDEWLGRAASLSNESFPLGLHLLGSHTHALAEALEWALRLEMCTDWEGSADFLRDLVNDPRPARILHSVHSLRKRVLRPALVGLCRSSPRVTAVSQRTWRSPLRPDRSWRRSAS